MNNTNKENIKQDSKLDINELKEKGKNKAKELSSKVMNEENKAKAMSFLQSLFIGSLKGLKVCIEILYKKLLPKINAKLDSLESAQKDTQ